MKHKNNSFCRRLKLEHYLTLFNKHVAQPSLVCTKIFLYAYYLTFAYISTFGAHAPPDTLVVKHTRQTCDTPLLTVLYVLNNGLQPAEFAGHHLIFFWVSAVVRLFPPTPYHSVEAPYGLAVYFWLLLRWGYNFISDVS